MGKMLKYSILVVLAVGCSRDAPELTISPAVIAGQIVGGGPQEVSVAYGPLAIDDGWSQRADSAAVVASVADDGAFKIPLQVKEPGFYRFSVAGERIDLFLQPGDSSFLEISLGTDQNRGIGVNFKGANADENQYMRELSAVIGGFELQLEQEMAVLFALGPDEFSTRIDSITKNIFDKQRELDVPSSDLSALVVERSKVDIDYWSKTLDLLYPSIHEEITGSLANVTPGYFEHLGQDSFDRAICLNSANCVRFLDLYVDTMSAGELKFSSRNLPREKLLSRFQTIQALEAIPEIKTYLLEQMFHTFRTSYGPKDWGKVYDLLVQSDPESPLVEQVRPQLEVDLVKRKRPDEIRVYRQIDGHSLEAHIFLPEDYEQNSDHAVYMSFHGGGWTIGTPEWGYDTCERMARNGMVAVSFEYRVADVHASGIPAAVNDAQFAVSWTRDQAAVNNGTLRIDPNRVIAAGFSAGGHLAAASAILKTDDVPFTNSIPNALVVQSASYNFSKGDFFKSMTGGEPEKYSLYHNVEAGLVPAIMIHSAYDHLTPVAEFREFIAKMESLNNDFEYRIFDNVGHFFRNKQVRSEVIQLTDKFLIDRGFMEE